MFLATLRHGRQVPLLYRELIGTWVLITGEYEEAEADAVAMLARPDAVTIDVGAHAGIITTAAAGAAREVWSFEPTPETSSRLDETVRLNGLGNVTVFRNAVGVGRSSATIDSTADPGLVTIGTGSLDVAVVALDDVWEDHGRPPVSLVKIDVEGAEEDVIRGARCLLAVCQPAVLVEVTDGERLQTISELLAAAGLKRALPPGFEPYNYLFTL
jgi:FkbM family methyltransferase